MAATVNTGVVFPVPGSRDTIDKLTYSTGDPTYGSTIEERLLYVNRWVRLALILVALGALLWWAVGQLGDGWDAVLDLFRSEEEPSVGALALLWVRLPGS